MGPNKGGSKPNMIVFLLFFLGKVSMVKHILPGSPVHHLETGPEEVREIHAIRLKIQDEKAQIGEAEYNRRVEAVLAEREAPCTASQETAGREL
jgi:hypothetical protein